MRTATGWHRIDPHHGVIAAGIAGLFALSGYPGSLACMSLSVLVAGTIAARYGLRVRTDSAPRSQTSDMQPRPTLGRLLPADQQARLGLLCLGIPGLAAVLSHAPPGGASAGSVAGRMVAFGLVATLFCWLVARDTSQPKDPAWRTRLPWLVAAVSCLAGLSAMQRPFEQIAITLLGATIEELVFRRELPNAFAGLFAPYPGKWFANLRAMLLGQLLFATCHFVVAGSPRPFGEGLPFVRLAASGTSLALLYRASGTLLLPISIHFLFNETLGNGTLGFHRPPGTHMVLAGAVLMCGLLILLELVDCPGDS